MSSSVSILLPAEILLRGADSRATTIGLLLPLSGLMGVAGPSILNCAILAAEEASERSDSPIELVLIDAGRLPSDVADEVALLVGAGLVEGLVGTHTSNTRVAVEAILADRVPYVFTPPHEANRRVARSLFLGSDPEEQLTQPISWIARNRHVRRWALIGNDYVWPQAVHKAARRVLRRLGQQVVMDRLVPLGGVDVAELVETARRSGADAVLVSLVGRDGIEFHRGVTEMGAGELFVRLCTALDENFLVAVGGDTSGRLFTAMPTFLTQTDERHTRLLDNYFLRFGSFAPPPGSYAEGCYDGTHLLAALLQSGLLESHAATDAANRLVARRLVAPRSRALAAADVVPMRRPASLAQADGTLLEVVLASA